MVSHFWRAHTVEVEREGEEEEEEEGEESQRKVWNLLSFVWNSYGNYDFGMEKYGTRMETMILVWKSMELVWKL